MSTEDVHGIPLHPGEEVRHASNPSWAAYPNTWIVTIVAAITIVGLLVAIPLVVWMWLKRRGTRYVVTTERVMVVKDVALSGRSSREYRIEDVRFVGTGQTWLGGALGVGTVSFATAATFGAFGLSNVVAFAGTGEYRTMANAVRELQREAA